MNKDIFPAIRNSNSPRLQASRGAGENKLTPGSNLRSLSQRSNVSLTVPGTLGKSTLKSNYAVSSVREGNRGGNSADDKKTAEHSPQSDGAASSPNMQPKSTSIGSVDSKEQPGQCPSTSTTPSSGTTSPGNSSVTSVSQPPTSCLRSDPAFSVLAPTTSATPSVSVSERQPPASGLANSFPTPTASSVLTSNLQGGWQVLDNFYMENQSSSFPGSGNASEYKRTKGGSFNQDEDQMSTATSDVAVPLAAATLPGEESLHLRSHPFADIKFSASGGLTAEKKEVHGLEADYEQLNRVPAKGTAHRPQLAKLAAALRSGNLREATTHIEGARQNIRDMSAAGSDEAVVLDAALAALARELVNQLYHPNQLSGSIVMMLVTVATVFLLWMTMYIMWLGEGDNMTMGPLPT